MMTKKDFIERTEESTSSTCRLIAIFHLGRCRRASPRFMLRMVFIDTIFSCENSFPGESFFPPLSFARFPNEETGKYLVMSLCYLIYAYMLMASHKSRAK